MEAYIQIIITKKSLQNKRDYGHNDVQGLLFKTLHAQRNWIKWYTKYILNENKYTYYKHISNENKYLI